MPEALAYESNRHDLVLQVGLAPIPGTQYAWTVPDNRVIHVIGVNFYYATSVAGAARRPFVGVFLGGVTIMQPCFHTASQPVAVTWRYHFSIGVPGQDLTGVTPVRPATLCHEMRLQAGDQMVIQSSAMDAADVFSEIYFYYKEWKDD